MVKKRKSYSIEDKKEILQWIIAEGEGIPTRAAKKIKLPPDTVRSWWTARGGVLNAGVIDMSRRRLTGAGRKGKISEYDDEIAESILYLRNEKIRVTRQTVKDIASDIAKREDIEDFHASDGWLTKFMQRNRFSFCRVTNLIALTDDKLLNRSFEYMEYLQSATQQSNPQNTILMDETAVYLEDPRRTTIAPIGPKHVLLNTTGLPL